MRTWTANPQTLQDHIERQNYLRQQRLSMSSPPSPWAPPVGGMMSARPQTMLNSPPLAMPLPKTSPATPIALGATAARAADMPELQSIMAANGAQVAPPAVGAPALRMGAASALPGPQLSQASPGQPGWQKPLPNLGILGPAAAGGDPAAKIGLVAAAQTHGVPLRLVQHTIAGAGMNAEKTRAAQNLEDLRQSAPLGMGELRHSTDFGRRANESPEDFAMRQDAIRQQQISGGQQRWQDVYRQLVAKRDADTQAAAERDRTQRDTEAQRRHELALAVATHQAPGVNPKDQAMANFYNARAAEIGKGPPAEAAGQMSPADKAEFGFAQSEFNTLAQEKLRIMQDISALQQQADVMTDKAAKKATNQRITALQESLQQIESRSANLNGQMQSILARARRNQPLQAPWPGAFPGGGGAGEDIGGSLGMGGYTPRQTTQTPPAASSGPTPGRAIPFSGDKAELVQGQIYEIDGSNWQWDGKQFVEVN